MIEQVVEQINATAAAAQARSQEGASSAQQAEMDEALAFLADLQVALTRYDVATVSGCLKLLPLALAKGDSKAEIDLAVERYARGLPSGVWITMDPGNRRFPIEAVGTGRLGARHVTGLPEPRFEAM